MPLSPDVHGLLPLPPHISLPSTKTHSPVPPQCPPLPIIPPPTLSSYDHSQNIPNFKSSPSISLSRRCLLLILSAPTFPLPSLADVQDSPFPDDQNVPPQDDNNSTPPLPSSPTITDRVFIDLTLCPTSFLPDSILGEAAASPSACPDSAPLGRVVLGLYGRLVPRTVANFKSMCTGSAGSSYKGTLVHKVLQGQYFVGGRQGRRDKGEVKPPLDLEQNTETVDPKSFSLKHLRPGTLSLCLSENDDEKGVRLDPNYRNVEFLITTGPGPCPQLDNQNIVFGEVLEGLDVVAKVATIPTYKPAERIRQFNDFAEFLGDERAQIARAIWNRPLQTVYISDCGELKVTKPSLLPSLP